MIGFFDGVVGPCQKLTIGYQGLVLAQNERSILTPQTEEDAEILRLRRLGQGSFSKKDHILGFCDQMEGTGKRDKSLS